MLQKLLEIILGRHTVESAMLHFHKALNKLEAVERQETEEITRREQDIAEAIAAREQAVRQRARAVTNADKLREFIGIEKTVAEDDGYPGFGPVGA